MSAASIPVAPDAVAATAAMPCLVSSDPSNVVDGRKFLRNGAGRSSAVSAVIGRAEPTSRAAAAQENQATYAAVRRPAAVVAAAAARASLVRLVCQEAGATTLPQCAANYGVDSAGSGCSFELPFDDPMLLAGETLTTFGTSSTAGSRSTCG